MDVHAVALIALETPLPPLRFVVLRFAATITPDSDAFAIDLLLHCRLAEGEEDVALTKPHDRHPFRLCLRHQIASERQMKTRHAAGVKLRLKSAEARQFFEHRECRLAGLIELAS